MISERHRGPDLRGEQAEPREEPRVGCPVSGRSRVYTQRCARHREKQAGTRDLARGTARGVKGLCFLTSRRTKTAEKVGCFCNLLLNAAVCQRLTTFMSPSSTICVPALEHKYTPDHLAGRSTDYHGEMEGLHIPDP